MVITNKLYRSIRHSNGILKSQFVKITKLKTLYLKSQNKDASKEMHFYLFIVISLQIVQNSI